MRFARRKQHGVGCPQLRDGDEVRLSARRALGVPAAQLWLFVVGDALVRWWVPTADLLAVPELVHGTRVMWWTLAGEDMHAHLYEYRIRAQPIVRESWRAAPWLTRGRPRLHVDLTADEDNAQGLMWVSTAEDVFSERVRRGMIGAHACRDGGPLPPGSLIGWINGPFWPDWTRRAVAHVVKHRWSVWLLVPLNADFIRPLVERHTQHMLELPVGTRCFHTNRDTYSSAAFPTKQPHVLAFFDHRPQRERGPVSLPAAPQEPRTTF